MPASAMPDGWEPIATYDMSAAQHGNVLIAGGSYRVPASLADEWRTMGERSAVARWDLGGWSNDCEHDADAYREYQPRFWMPMPKGVQTCTCRACLDNPVHWSSCAVHSEPAYPKGPCDCGRLPATPAPEAGS